MFAISCITSFHRYHHCPSLTFQHNTDRICTRSLPRQVGELAGRRQTVTFLPRLGTHPPLLLRPLIPANLLYHYRRISSLPDFGIHHTHLFALIPCSLSTFHSIITALLLLHCLDPAHIYISPYMSNNPHYRKSRSLPSGSPSIGHRRLRVSPPEILASCLGICKTLGRCTEVYKRHSQAFLCLLFLVSLRG